jgi:L-2,4-diaminobutyric acid acetyltransferase
MRNRKGFPFPTTRQAVAAQLGNAVDAGALALDGRTLPDELPLAAAGACGRERQRMPRYLDPVTFRSVMSEQRKSQHGLERRIGGRAGGAGVMIAEPELTDGPQLWRLARDSQVLDLNSGYAYLMWCRDFAGTSAVARVDGAVVGFVTGFVRPQAPDTVMVWQVAVHAAQRGRNLAARMLHTIVDRLSPQGIRWLHTTVSPGNQASIRLFSALARDRRTGIERRDLFAPQDFPPDEPGGHEAEDLYVIGPFITT